MALTLTNEQRELFSKASATFEMNGKTAKVYGVRGVLEYFGFELDNTSGDLAASGVDKVISRRSHRRSRWLGDIIKSGVTANTATAFLYPSRRGNALPGVPIKLENIQTGRKWTVQLDGEIGVLIAYLSDGSRPFDIQLYGKTGNRYGEPILGGSMVPGA